MASRTSRGAGLVQSPARPPRVSPPMVLDGANLAGSAKVGGRNGMVRVGGCAWRSSVGAGPRHEQMVPQSRMITSYTVSQCTADSVLLDVWRFARGAQDAQAIESRRSNPRRNAGERVVAFVNVQLRIAGFH